MSHPQCGRDHGGMSDNTKLTHSSTSIRHQLAVNVEQNQRVAFWLKPNDGPAAYVVRACELAMAASAAADAAELPSADLLCVVVS